MDSGFGHCILFGYGVNFFEGVFDGVYVVFFKVVDQFVEEVDYFLIFFYVG